jgi:hypothetical protein
MLPDVVIMDFTGLNLKYFAYFTTDKGTRLNLLYQNSSCRGRFIEEEACTRREQQYRFPLPFITLFHNRFSKCRSAASNQVCHILKISVGKRGRSRVEILANYFR